MTLYVCGAEALAILTCMRGCFLPTRYLRLVDTVDGEIHVLPTPRFRASLEVTGGVTGY